jgi:serine/threonine protein kinase
MAMSSKRWNVITPSEFPWEREALEFVRAGLPDNDPYLAWSNFEFIADDGSINEVDLLILTPQGFYLIEIKSRPGVLVGDSITWNWSHEGRVRVDDNPLLLANRKAKKLASLLKRQKACNGIQFPYLDALIFLSNPNLSCQLQALARNRVCLRDRPDKDGRLSRGGILAGLKNRDYEGVNENVRSGINRPQAAAISRAIEQAGIRKSQSSRRVGDYVLGELLFESPTGTYQEWEATHVSVATSKRRIRIYSVGGNASENDRETIRRAAQREYQIIENLDHPGILKVESFTEHVLGPALIFKHDPEAVRLDHFLSESSAKLSVDARLNLIRPIAEALKFAHEKRVVHRALSPQSILVKMKPGGNSETKIFNWQTGYRDAATSTHDAPKLTATIHPEILIEDASTVYLAPEGISDLENLGEALDIFSLGAISYHIFSGQPPASSALELNQKLREGRGLLISSVMDGAGKELQELIQFSTHPEVINRYTSVADFLTQLEAVEDEITRPEERFIQNPLEARAGDLLEGGFKVISRLGRGSSAIAFLVEKDGKEVVLKLSNEVEHNKRVLAEAETIRKLRHQNIVEAYDVFEIGGLKAFTMQRAGEETLAHRLRKEGRLHLDLLQRFGEDLLDAVRYLEEEGIQHRDIKPDNIGIRPLGRGDKLHLLLFDFSLSQTPPDNIRAGTEPYLDPFLSLRKPKARWDLSAERFSAAMTLYEMATGTRPQWGDGQSRADLLDCEVTLNSELFDPNLRESMLAFFTQALRRDSAERFDNCEEMLREWRKIFEGVDKPVSGAVEPEDFDIDAMIKLATPATSVVALGLSTRAVNAMDRINANTVADLLRINPRRLMRLPGVGTKTRNEIVGLVNALRRRFSEIAAPSRSDTDTSTDADNAGPQVVSVDLLAQVVAKFSSAGKRQAEKRILHTFIGWDAAEEGFSLFDCYDWPSQSDVAKNLGLTRARVGQVVTAARTRWLKNPSVESVTNTVAELIESNGGAMTTRELIAGVLAARGSDKDEPLRFQLASVVTRAAVETERGSKSPRFIDRRRAANPNLIIARDAEMADYVERLSIAADRLAELDPVATPARALETLRDVKPCESSAPLTDSRLVRLAVAASANAAVSSRMEIYGRGMSALRSLRLAHGALVGARELTVEEIQQRIDGRYPDTEKLPERPDLDRLLEEVGLELIWSPEAAKGKGAYRPRFHDTESGLSSSTHHPRFQTRLASAAPIEVDPDIADAQVFEQKLRRSHNEGGSLTLTVAPRDLQRADEELVRRFKLDRRNVDDMLIRAMREFARENQVDWNVVLRADAEPAESADWRKLMMLVGASVPIVEQQLSNSETTILLVYPGLLARYKQWGMVDHLRDRVGTAGSNLHGLWILLPSHEQTAFPTLNGTPVPVIAGQWARVPEAWISNAHRSDNGNTDPH